MKGHQTLVMPVAEAPWSFSDWMRGVAAVRNNGCTCLWIVGASVPSRGCKACRWLRFLMPRLIFYRKIRQKLIDEEYSPLAPPEPEA